MNSILLFCVPSKKLSDLYRKMSEKEVADNYTNMAIKEFDDILNFSEEYEPTEPDMTGLIDTKVDRNKKLRDLYLTLFIRQPIIGVRNREVDILATSYLFNPESTMEGLYLPDMDVIEFQEPTFGGRQEKNLQYVVREIKLLYEKYKWKTHILLDEKEKNIKIVSSRFPNGIDIFDHNLLIQLATKNIGYNPNELYF